jgi:hypothetical protein
MSGTRRRVCSQISIFAHSSAWLYPPAAQKAPRAPRATTDLFVLLHFTNHISSLQGRARGTHRHNLSQELGSIPMS